MDERGEAIVLATKILDRPFADPDDDLAVLARQLLRCEQRHSTIPDLLAKTRMEERAAIVAWLREDAQLDEYAGDPCWQLANAIESVHHLQGEGGR